MVRQRGLSLLGLIVTLGILAFVGLMAAKLLPTYLEYFAVRKMLAAMEKNGELNGTPQQIRYTFEKRNLIEDVRSMSPDDLQVSRQGGQTIVTADWSVKVPLFGNVNACIDFSATAGEGAQPESPQ